METLDLYLKDFQRRSAKQTAVVRAMYENRYNIEDTVNYLNSLYAEDMHFTANLTHDAKILMQIIYVIEMDKLLELDTDSIVGFNLEYSAIGLSCDSLVMKYSTIIAEDLQLEVLFSAKLSQEDILLLRSLGKIQSETTNYTSTQDVSMC